MLDPYIEALAQRLQDHIDRGEMRPTDTRMAAMSLISPILIGALHQRRLGGATCNPVDQSQHCHHVAESFIAAYRVRQRAEDDPEMVK
ncbi:TetR/AcrR family transcriptional regulator C-terminal domain-containing protein [Paracoccus sp. S1E-3]|nr:TetR/AcrR family transcriptional regulator C-terminal domain-containing protein [Paracoccus sp. S1E-3]